MSNVSQSSLFEPCLTSKTHSNISHISLYRAWRNSGSFNLTFFMLHCTLLLQILSVRSLPSHPLPWELKTHFLSVTRWSFAAQNLQFQDKNPSIGCFILFLHFLLSLSQSYQSFLTCDPRFSQTRSEINLFHFIFWLMSMSRLPLFQCYTILILMLIKISTWLWQVSSFTFNFEKLVWQLQTMRARVIRDWHRKYLTILHTGKIFEITHLQRHQGHHGEELIGQHEQDHLARDQDHHPEQQDLLPWHVVVEPSRQDLDVGHQDLAQLGLDFVGELLLNHGDVLERVELGRGTQSCRVGLRFGCHDDDDIHEVWFLSHFYSCIVSQWFTSLCPGHNVHARTLLTRLSSTQQGRRTQAHHSVRRSGARTQHCALPSL